MEINDITELVIGAAIKVHRALGPGLLESTYEACLSHELVLMGLRVERQKPMPVFYNGTQLDVGYRIDMIVEGQVVVEIKCSKKIKPIHEAQMLTYLKLSNSKVGLIINFKVEMLRSGLRRIVRDYKGPSPFAPRLRG